MIIYRQIHRITTMCFEKDDHKILIHQIYRRFMKRGYNRQNVLPIFEKSIVHYKKKAPKPESPPPQQFDDQIKTQQILFHIRYNPGNVNYFEYQHRFKLKILKPKYHHHISNINNKAVNETKTISMVVAYSGPPNLVNFLSYRKLNTHIFPSTT